MFNRGSLVIVFIFGVSAAMGFYAVWHQHQQGRRCLEFWGAESANLIRHAPQVELWELTGPAPQAEATADEPRRQAWLALGEQRFAVGRRRDISQARGLVHARHALIADAGFDWSTPASDEPNQNWFHVLRFTREQQSTTVLLDYEGGVVADLTSGRRTRMSAALAKSEKTFLQKQLADAAAP